MSCLFCLLDLPRHLADWIKCCNCINQARSNIACRAVERKALWRMGVERRKANERTVGERTSPDFPGRVLEGASAASCPSHTWSVHQYQRDGMDIPNRIPGHGRSDVSGSRKMWKASSRGSPQLLFSVRLVAKAKKYFSIRPSSPPTAAKPRHQRKPKSAKSSDGSPAVMGLLETMKPYSEYSYQGELVP